MKLRVFFVVQGEGRGHMTQAIAMHEMLARHGHQVVGVLIGANQTREVPAFFQEAFGFPVGQFRSPGFSLRKAKQVSLADSLLHVCRTLPDYGESMRYIEERLTETKPDLVVNFLDPVMGYFKWRRRTTVPMLTVAHHFMFDHPKYPKPRFFRLRSFGMRRYVALTGANAEHLGLSFYEAENMPAKKLHVCPPILRRQLFDLKPVTGDYLLIYLLNHGYADEIRAWHLRNPSIPIHCFYDKPGAPAEETVVPGLTFHALHGEKFLRLMAGARGVVCTAGFESISEAAYLNKPLLMVPVAKHLEQAINSLDAELHGLGVRDSAFNLDRLLKASPEGGRLAFRDWVNRAEDIAVDVAERTVATARGGCKTMVHTAKT